MKTVHDEIRSCMKNEFSALKFVGVDDLKLLSRFFQCRAIAAGEVLWKEGDPCDYLAFIASGRVEVKKETEFAGKQVVVGIYGRGAVVGAICILDGSPRAVTAVTLEDGMLVTITREDFEGLIARYPKVGTKLMRGMLLSVSRRLRGSFERLAKFF